MSNDVTLSCQCGAFEARLMDANGENGNHAICYCEDCQAFARHLGQSDRVMDASGGTALFQTQPHRVDIAKGHEHLAVMQLAPKGLYRWHTSCCNTPLCNTLGTPKFAFAGFMTANMTAGTDALGPVQFRYKRDQAAKPVSEPSGSLARFAFRTMRNALISRLNGNWKQTPFFDEDGRSVVKPYVLTDTERAAAYAK